MLKVFILVSGKTFFFFAELCLMNKANFSPEGVWPCSASENKQK